MSAKDYNTVKHQMTPEWDSLWAKLEKVEALEKRVQELENALKSCHGIHQFPTQCAELVDVYYHELFTDAYNPHKHWSERK
jgi:hypothetical protein